MTFTGRRHGSLWTSGENIPFVLFYVSVGKTVARQITEMAADVVECCALARRVALRLADALTDDTRPEPRSREDLSRLSFGKDALSTRQAGYAKSCEFARDSG